MVGMNLYRINKLLSLKSYEKLQTKTIDSSETVIHYDDTMQTLGEKGKIKHAWMQHKEKKGVASVLSSVR